MEILITCYKLNLSGSSTYTLTLASELKKRHHNVSIFTLFPEKLTKEFEKKGIHVFSDPIQIQSQKYNIIIGQHSIPTLTVRGIFPTIPLIFISHGVIPFLEQPPLIDINIQKYIVVSEEIKNNLIKNYCINPDNVVLIRNFININRFKSQKKINKKLKTVLFLSNHECEDVRKNIKDACKKLKLKSIFVGKKNKIFEVEKYINKSDLVISLGRGILESMSCGRAVIVFDYNGGDGMVVEKNISEIRKNNFSGRRYNIKYNTNDLIKEIKKYSVSMSKINREIVLRDYNVESSVDRIEGICKKIVNSFVFKQISIPTKELIWYHQNLISAYSKKNQRQTIKQIVLERFEKIIRR